MRAAAPGVRSAEGGGGGGGGVIRVIRPGSSSSPPVQSQVMNNSHQHTNTVLLCITGKKPTNVLSKIHQGPTFIVSFVGFSPTFCHHALASRDTTLLCLVDITEYNNLDL